MFADLKAWLLGLVERALGNLASFFAGYVKGGDDQKKEQMENKIEHLEKEAERPAHRPNSDVDINGVLDKWKSIKRKEKP